jgi:hypothetical protein
MQESMCLWKTRVIDANGKVAREGKISSEPTGADRLVE